MTDRRLAQLPPAPDPLPLPVVDNHCHLDITRDGAPATDVATALDRARAVGVDRVVQIGCDLASARWTVQVVEEHDALLGGVALHPNEVPALAAAGELDRALDEIERLAVHPRVRAVGETGLDYYRTGPEGRRDQQEAFRRHIDLARRTGKALQIHDRDAHEDVLRILTEEGAPDRVVLHCFSGDIEMARECVRRGYYLSFAGTVTFKNARDLRDALAVTPLEHLLVETDAPYLAPQPVRGKPNEPANVVHTARFVAELRGMEYEALERVVERNAARLFGW